VSYADHDHRGEYADDRHDHDGDYAEKHHRHYDDESTARGLREDLAAAEDRIRTLEDDLRGALAFIRILDRLRPTCVICRDATADRQTVRGPACTDCVGDLPDDGPDPDRPETWAFGEPPVPAARPDEAQAGDLAEVYAEAGWTGPDLHAGVLLFYRPVHPDVTEPHRGYVDWQPGAVTAAGVRVIEDAPGPKGLVHLVTWDRIIGVDEEPPAPAAEDGDPPEPVYDSGPEVDDEGGMSEYRYTLPEDYERGQS